MNSYDEDYYIRGKQSGKSLYENYRWLPELTIPMVESIIKHCGIEKADHVLDFGCARGYTVRAFYELGYDAWGYDVSEWAIHNADPLVASRLLLGDEKFGASFEWIVAKDVLEHVPQVAVTITELMESATIGVFAVVPLSAIDGEPYIVADYEKDVTHIHRLTLASWARLFMRPGWRVEASYRLKGVKDNYSIWENGNGFVVARRCER